MRLILMAAAVALAAALPLQDAPDAEENAAERGRRQDKEQEDLPSGSGDDGGGSASGEEQDDDWTDDTPAVGPVGRQGSETVAATTGPSSTVPATTASPTPAPSPNPVLIGEQPRTATVQFPTVMCGSFLAGELNAATIAVQGAFLAANSGLTAESVLYSIGSCSESRRRAAGELVVTISLTGAAAAAAAISTSAITATFVYSGQASTSYTSNAVIASPATEYRQGDIQREGGFLGGKGMGAFGGKGMGEFGGKGMGAFGGKGMGEFGGKGMGEFGGKGMGEFGGSGKGMGGSETGKTGKMSATTDGWDSALDGSIKGKASFAVIGGLVFGVAATGLLMMRRNARKEEYTMVPQYSGRPTSQGSMADEKMSATVLTSLMADDQIDRKYLSFTA